jgi:hypothetical protein
MSLQGDSHQPIDAFLTLATPLMPEGSMCCTGCHLKDLKKSHIGRRFAQPEPRGMARALMSWRDVVNSRSVFRAMAFSIATREHHRAIAFGCLVRQCAADMASRDLHQRRPVGGARGGRLAVLAHGAAVSMRLAAQSAGTILTPASSGMMV